MLSGRWAVYSGRMDESNPTFLLKQAAKCRRLASGLFDSDDAEQLRSLAREYETKARDAKRRPTDQR